MNAPSPKRSFAGQRAVRGEDTLQIGLMGPPGGGKTWSALELAVGMQRVRGGEIVLIETEGKRSLKLADFFNFIRVPMEAPFNPLAFMEAILEWQATKPACIIVDSLSDEHEGTGGMLEMHDAIVEQSVQRARARNDRRPDWEIAEAAGQSAWIKPKAERLKLILAMDRFTVPIIYTFRAREKVKPMKNDKGKMAPTKVGYQPIAPIEIVHKLDLTCLLPPNARGVPVWKSSTATEDFFIKLPEYLIPYIREGKSIDADMGEGFAKWMKGDTILTGPRLAQAARNAAQNGVESLSRWFGTRTTNEKKEVKPLLDSELKASAALADKTAAEAAAVARKAAEQVPPADPPPQSGAQPEPAEPSPSDDWSRAAFGDDDK